MLLNIFLSSRGHESWSRSTDFKGMQSDGLLGLVFDTGLSATPHMGHLWFLASRWSVPVHKKLGIAHFVLDFGPL